MEWRWDLNRGFPDSKPGTHSIMKQQTVIKQPPREPGTECRQQSIRPGPLRREPQQPSHQDRVERLTESGNLCEIKAAGLFLMLAGASWDTYYESSTENTVHLVPVLNRAHGPTGHNKV